MTRESRSDVYVPLNRASDHDYTTSFAEPEFEETFSTLDVGIPSIFHSQTSEIPSVDPCSWAELAEQLKKHHSASVWLFSRFILSCNEHKLVHY